MKMVSCAIIDSPARPGYVRLSAEVEYDKQGLKPETYWFEVHESQKEFLSTSGNPWLMCLAPVAITLQEPLHINRPVDPTLLKNTHKLMDVWSFWFPRLKPMPIFAERMDAPEHEKPSRTLSFFSGGVDAFFTALYHDETEGPYDKIHIDDLVNIWGFDIPYSSGEAYLKSERSLREASKLIGKELVSVATNMRQTQLKNCEWEYLYHGAALASVAYALEKKYDRALIASSGGYRDSFPQGSHLALMPLFSSGRMQIEQSGATFSRSSKIEWLSRSEAAMRHLHVCFHLGNEENCSRCLKCFRTMLVLDLMGSLDKFVTFDRSKYDFHRAGKIFLWDVDDVRQAIEIRSLALQKDRMDIVTAMNKSVQHTDRIKKTLAFVRPLKKSLWGRSLYDRVENRLLRGSVGGEERYYPASNDSLFVHYNRIQST
jgi:hypothetical protein